jgi:hypothetical protein
MKIAYNSHDAPGAIPRGTPPIVKVATDAGDINPIGTRGSAWLTAPWRSDRLFRRVGGDA